MIFKTNGVKLEKCFAHKVGCDSHVDLNVYQIIPSHLCGPNKDWNFILTCPKHAKLLAEHFTESRLTQLLEHFNHLSFEEAVVECDGGEQAAMELHTDWQMVMDFFEGDERGKNYMSLVNSPDFNPVWDASVAVKQELEVLLRQTGTSNPCFF